MSAGLGDFDPSEVRVALARSGALDADSTAFVEFRHALSAYGLEVEEAGVERLSPRFSRYVVQEPARWVVVVCRDATSRPDIAESLQRELREKGIQQNQIITIAVVEGRGLQLARSVQVRVEILQRRLEREGAKPRQRRGTPLSLVPPSPPAAPQPAAKPATPPPTPSPASTPPSPPGSPQDRLGDRLEPRSPSEEDFDPIEPLQGSNRLPLIIAATVLGLAGLVGGSYALRGCGSAEAGAPEQQADAQPQPDPQPQPDSQPQPDPQPQPDSQPQPDPQPEPDPQPQDLEPEPDPQPVVDEELAVEDVDDVEPLVELSPDEEAKLIAAGLHQQAFRALDILLVDANRSKRGNFAAAKERCEKRELAGVGGWRLPTVGEASSVTAAGMVKKDRYWTATRGDTFGRKQVVWDSRRKRIKSFSTRFRGARTICVRLQSEVDAEPTPSDE